MNEDLNKELESYIQKYTELQKRISLLQADLLRLEGLIFYLKEKKDKSPELTNKEN